MRSGLECRNRSHTASASGVVILQTTIRISNIWSVFSAKTVLTVSSREVVSSTTGRITDTRKESALIVITLCPTYHSRNENVGESLLTPPDRRPPQFATIASNRLIH